MFTCLHLIIKHLYLHGLILNYLREKPFDTSHNINLFLEIHRFPIQIELFILSHIAGCQTKNATYNN